MPKVNSITFHPFPTVHNFRNLTGQKFHLLTVLGFLGSRPAGSKGSPRGWWLCKCACGQLTETYTSSIVSGNTTSCGCRQKIARATHGLSDRTEYGNWREMNQRCGNPNTAKYPYYGGSGVKVCERWRHNFARFLADMGPKPSPKHTLDRYPDKRGNYEPGNVRWATRAEQGRNRTNNHNITFNNETMCLTDWALRLNMGLKTLSYRLRKWSLERAMTEPVNVSFRR